MASKHKLRGQLRALQERVEKLEQMHPPNEQAIPTPKDIECECGETVFVFTVNYGLEPTAEYKCRSCNREATVPWGGGLREDYSDASWR